MAADRETERNEDKRERERDEMRRDEMRCAQDRHTEPLQAAIVRSFAANLKTEGL